MQNIPVHHPQQPLPSSFTEPQSQQPQQQPIPTSSDPVTMSSSQQPPLVTTAESQPPNPLTNSSLEQQQHIAPVPAVIPTTIPQVVDNDQLQAQPAPSNNDTVITASSSVPVPLTNTTASENPSST